MMFRAKTITSPFTSRIERSWSDNLQNVHLLVTANYMAKSDGVPGLTGIQPELLRSV
jgi:hypothetical protein